MSLDYVKRALAVVAVAALAGAASAEDLTIVSNTTIGGKTTTSTQYLSASKIRTSDGENDTILDLGGTGAITVIDHKKKEYWQATQAEIAAAYSAMEKQMEAMGPMMEKIMGKVGAVSVTKGTAPRKVAGYDTEHWVVSMGDNMKYEVWAAPSLNVPTQYFDALKARYAIMGPMAKRFSTMFDEMRKIKGFPLATASVVNMSMMKSEYRSEATEVKSGPIAASAFEVPAGYKKKDAPLPKM